MASLQGKVAIVTGASRGLGRETALLLAEQGMKVVICGRTADELNSLVDEIYKNGGEATSVVADVSQESDVQNLIHTTLATYGTIHVLINNAGVGKYGELSDFTVEDYDRIMNTNVRSTFLCTQAVVPEMKKNQEGNIINVASVAGIRGLPNESVYCASKFAQVGFTQSIDHELRHHGIKATALCPGGINTHFAFGEGRTPGDPLLDEMMDAKTVAQTILMILSQPKNTRMIEVVMRPMNEAL